jgi:hypothetical protein
MARLLSATADESLRNVGIGHRVLSVPVERQIANLFVRSVISDRPEQRETVSIRHRDLAL